MSNSENKLSGIAFATLAGACAALSSVFGKFAMDVQFIPRILKQFYPVSPEISTQIEFVSRCACFGMIFVCNALMWNFFVKSMNLSTSLSATVVNTSLNYFFTAIFGLLIFGETLPLEWWMGASLILVGLFLINKGTPSKIEETKKDK